MKAADNEASITLTSCYRPLNLVVLIIYSIHTIASR